MHATGQQPLDDDWCSGTPVIHRNTDMANYTKCIPLTFCKKKGFFSSVELKFVQYLFLFSSPLWGAKNSRRHYAQSQKQVNITKRGGKVLHFVIDCEK